MRPTTHDDLPNYIKSDRVIATVEISRFAAIPGAVAAYGAFLDTLRDREDLIIEGDDVKQAVPESELDQCLRDRQRAWDRGRDAYSAYLNDGTVPDNQFVWYDYLTAEGIPAPSVEYGTK